MQLIDTHAHLDFTDDVEGWCQRAKDNGVNKIICVGTSVEASKKCVEIAEKYSSKDSGQARTSVARMTKDTDLQIYATVGIHAQDGEKDMQKYSDAVGELKKIARSSKIVVGVGECGFDFYVPGEKRIPAVDKDRKFQKELFGAQIKLAAELELPLVVHCRNAWEETLDTLSGKFSLRSNNNLTGVFHSWTGDWEAAQKALGLGFYISFSGIVTFGNALKVQEVATKMPIARMILETDSPFLAPLPLRGSPNEPKNVKIIAEFIAQLRNSPVDEIANVTSANARGLFEI